MTDDFFQRLAAPFDPALVSWRPGKVSKSGDKARAMALAYIDARDVMERLDEVAGPAGWSCAYSHANGKTVCDLAVLCGDQWVSKADGAGDSDIEAEKGALSDAFKRAAVRWGIGRYLYGIPSPWVDIDQYKQIVDTERPKLEALLAKYTTEFEWGSPESRATLRVLTQTIKQTVQTADDVRIWREANTGTLTQMRVKARGHVDELLESIAETSRAVAA